MKSVITVILAFALLPLGGWAVSTCWGYFIVPVFSVQPLTIIQAVGLLFMVSAVTVPLQITIIAQSDKALERLDVPDGIGVRTFMQTLSYLFIVILAYLWHAITT